jgi:ParB family transcriptional regulator, chromosome partitioning protein
MGDFDISKIKQSTNIRHNVPYTEELAKSIQQKGLLQPILVRTLDGYLEIVVGNRGFCACKALGWKKIACHIIELGDKQAFEVSPRLRHRDLQLDNNKEDHGHLLRFLES